MRKINKNLLSVAIGSALLGIATMPVAHADTPTTWTTTIDAATYGSAGTITFNDWGYKGPTNVGANDFQVGSGFDSSRIGQIQHVVTQNPDWVTPDSPWTAVADVVNSPTFANANMDGGVNFYRWGYTTPVNSTFNNMQIDKAGNYYIAKDDMSFGLYDTFQYKDKTGVNPDQTFDTNINFKPYTISDAMGWCGSVMTSNPNGLAQMAGQVTFDFAMDIYFDFGAPNPGTYSSTQLIDGFVMRSYGDYTVNVNANGGTGENMYSTSSAVGNNTDPSSVVPGVGGDLDPAYHNLVSFHGAGVLPKGVWVSADSFNTNGSKKMRTDHNATTGESTQVWDVKIVAAGTAGATWHANSFAGYAYILRADGMRILDYVNPEGHSDYVPTTVPVPAAAWLFGSGLLGLAGLARRKKK